MHLTEVDLDKGWSDAFLLQYPVDGATNHLQMAHKVFECDYLLPNYVSDRAQDVINKVS